MYPTGSHAPPEKGGQYPPPQGGGYGAYPPPSGGAYPPPSGGAYPPPPGGAPGYPGGGYGAPPGGYGAPPGGGYGAPPGGNGAPPGGYGAPQGGYGGYGPPPGTGPVGHPPGGYAPPPMGNMGNFGPQPTGPIFNPPIPFQAPFPGGAHPGRSVIVKGVITGDDGFTLNFKCGEENNFHFNPRPNQGCVVYNHNQHGWGTEERHQNPFHPGQPFELCITIEPNQYKVFVNHQPFPSFNARMFPIEKFELIQIGGSVNVQEINFS